jgi:AcrR family transcriptional regulator
MRDRIVAAAIRVLADEGALGFTTTRVAEEAGISVGSLYQYFPNKHALALAVHEQAVVQGWNHVQRLLDDPDLSPRATISAIAHWFFAAESDEARDLGDVFGEAEVLLRNTPANPQLETIALERFTSLLQRRSSRPRARDDARFLMTVLESVGKAAATQPITTRERQRWASATATMLCDHLGVSDTLPDDTPA